MKYSKLFNTTKTAQPAPIPGANQKPNHAGGYTWEVDMWTMLDRFLILGSDTGTYYVKAQKLTLEHGENVIKALEQDGERVVNRIVEVSTKGLAPKNDSAIFALAIAASFGDEKTRALALSEMPKVCRTGTHLFAFAEACDGMRGWGRGLRKAIAKWYIGRSAESLAYSLVKYQAREGWSNRDLLRLSHPVAPSEAHNVLFKWAVSGEVTGEAPVVQAVVALRETKSLAKAKELIKDHKIPREAIPTEMLTEVEIWEALLADMPVTAMLRNLSTMTKVGLLKHGWLSGDSFAVSKVIETLRDTEKLAKARIHPVAVLAALNTYAGGKGVRSDATWKPVRAIVDELDSAFYATFKSVASTGKRLVLGLDVSGSMAGTMVAGVAGLDCRSACGAMALITETRESAVTHLAFDTDVYKLDLSQSMRLDKVVKLLEKTGGGGTDCAAPIQYAIKHRIPVDAFVIYTDSETWEGHQHPSQAMNAYRNAMGIDAKLVVVAMASNRCSIGDPRDPRVLNVVGFDASVPGLISEFVGS
ncbi:MAG TPA: TROVE domain-containing protein [Fimbriimonas sp.]|nr:TROVE domain-containing protein [Fimbriimonas sp.]